LRHYTIESLREESLLITEDNDDCHAR
jgi:hypothetical protein